MFDEVSKLSFTNIYKYISKSKLAFLVYISFKKLIEYETTF